MLKQVTLEKAIDIVRLSIALSFCWPLPPRSSRAKLFLYKTTQLFATISIISLLLPLLYAMYVRSDDIEIISLCLSQVILTTQGIIQTIICSNKHDTLQSRLISGPRNLTPTHLIVSTTLYNALISPLQSNQCSGIGTASDQWSRDDDRKLARWSGLKA
ncbi:hypothetical protein K0M31_016387 [Melipona bicolor]|uniref:Uncharacterized protein n=1 Tax=Melipona bicolor TaxID=60889 RepID=A0AA40KTM1_9HYME|nr:hypothetical protein K0M31_016387 [Melipona bicolor]